MLRGMVPEFKLQDLRGHLKLFRVGEILSCKRVARGPEAEVMRLLTTHGEFYARVVRNRSIKDARFEEAVLLHVGQRGLAVPKMVSAGTRGGVLALGPRSQLSVFAPIAGRMLGAFEVRSAHMRAVGRYLAQLHGTSRGLRRRRRHPHQPDRTSTVLQRGLKRAPTREHDQALELLCMELVRHQWGRELPQSIVHGGLGRENTRFEHERLVCAFGFRDSATGPMAYDLAMSIAHWAFPLDDFDISLAHDLVAGYQSLRPLALIERESLYDLCCYASARVAVARFWTHEVGESWTQERGVYRDYRHFVKRLEALQALGAERFSAAVIEAPSRAPLGHGFGATL